MSMTLDELKSKQAHIEKLILTLGNDPKPILDGVLNPELYLKASPKILWVLQEAYDTKGKRGGWRMSELIDRFVKEKGFGATRPTWEIILYVSWSILNRKNDSLMRWSLMPDHDKQPEIISTLYNIAFINVKKLPNVVDSRSRKTAIAQAYGNNREILYAQISAYQPDIIIFGNTMTYFYDHLVQEGLIVKHSPDTNYYVNGEQLLIDVYHPAYRRTRGQRERYCDEILEVTEQWLNRNNSHAKKETKW